MFSRRTGSTLKHQDVMKKEEMESKKKVKQNEF